MDEFKLPRITDAHVHWRQGTIASNVVHWTTSVAANAIVMPNTDPVITTDTFIEWMDHYRSYAGPYNCNIHLTCMLKKDTTTKQIEQAKKLGAIGYKLYPAGATTQSDHGIPLDWLAIGERRFRLQLQAMQANDLVLLCHGENHSRTTMKRERAFHDIFKWIVRNHSNLRVTFEHITDKNTLELIRRLHYEGSRVFGTITLHHLLTNVDDVIGDKLQAHLFCKPFPKKRKHMRALIEVALNPYPCFGLGSDSAPHCDYAKYTRCGCAGVYTAPILVQTLLQLIGPCQELVKFTSTNANNFYGFDEVTETITAKKQDLVIPNFYDGDGTGDIVPFKYGDRLSWNLDNDSLVRRNPIQ